MSRVRSVSGTFITRSQLNLASPVSAKITLKTSAAGPAAIAWRVNSDKDFLSANRVSFKIKASDDWQTHEITLPADAPVIHVRVHLPYGPAQFRSLDFQPAK